MAAPSSIVIPTGRRAPNEGDQPPWMAEAVEEDDDILSTPRTKHRRGAQTQEQKRKKRKKRRQRQRRMKEAENVVAAARDSNGDESTIEEEEIEASIVNYDDGNTEEGEIVEALEAHPSQTTIHTKTSGARGIRLIPKNLYDADAALTFNYTKQLLGDRARRMTNDEITAEWNNNKLLKQAAAKFMRIELNRIVIEISAKDPYLGERTIAGLQKKFASLNPKKKKAFARSFASFWKIVQPGMTPEMPRDVDTRLETEFMRQNKLKYCKDGSSLDDAKGCIAQTFLKTMRNMRKRIHYDAMKKGGHKFLLTACRPTVQGTGVTKGLSRKKDRTFRMDFLRKRTSNLIGKSESDDEGDSNEEEEEEGDDNDSDDDGESNANDDADDDANDDADDDADDDAKESSSSDDSDDDSVHPKEKPGGPVARGDPFPKSNKITGKKGKTGREVRYCCITN
jgi:hypothetical protein